MLKEKNLIIIGAGGHAISVANVAISAQFNIKYFADPEKADQILMGIKVKKEISDIKDFEECAFAIAIGENVIREKIYNELIFKNKKINFPALIHQSAVISNLVTIDEGTVIMPNTVVGPNSHIGKFCILNTCSSIDHDCSMLDFASLGPGVITGGNVEIGRRSAICIAAVVKHGIKIGKDCVVGANSYLNQDILDKDLVYGSPAKVIRTKNDNESYLK